MFDSRQEAGTPTRPPGAACRFPKGTSLLRQGEAIDSVYWLQQGVIKIVRSEDDRDLLVNWRSAPGVLGAADAILGAPSSYTAEALTDCLARQIGVPEFEQLRRDGHRDVVMRELAREINDMARSLGCVCANTPRARLERLLIKWLDSGHHARRDGTLQPTIPLKKRELAQAIDVTPEHLSRLLGRLEAQGVVKREAGWILIPAGSRLAGAIAAPGLDREQEGS